MALLRAAVGFNLFRLHSRTAPGLTFFGGTADPGAARPGATELRASLVGAGETPRQAFEACVGEGVEYLSQFRHEADEIVVGSSLGAAAWNGDAVTKSLLDLAGAAAPDGIDWIAAKDMCDNTTQWLPANIVVRDSALVRPGDERFALSSGCAAGPTWAAAVASALFELIERDAVAMWWKGGRGGGPIALEILAELGALEFLAKARRDSRQRITTLLDISGDIGIPCVAAVSFDRSGGRFAGGYACHLDAARACRGAIVEMCQMEFGREVASAKLPHLPPDALTEADLAQERRAGGISVDRPGVTAGFLGSMSLRSGDSPAQANVLAETLDRLTFNGLHAYAVDLTRPAFGIPVARVVVPGLRPYPSRILGAGVANAAAGWLQKPLPVDNIDLL
ncbi:YcaO-like family protein [Mesorhizobium sp. IMUNJ 23232]|uniref:YcaO-like family protein n=1 Tax=Mesorhizobium sp. IMUNJ 23232 TaxID=3376064 RepID=UPI003791DAF5